MACLTDADVAAGIDRIRDAAVDLHRHRTRKRVGNGLTRDRP
jgi:hypothetical protein